MARSESYAVRVDDCYDYCNAQRRELRSQLDRSIPCTEDYGFIAAQHDAWSDMVDKLYSLIAKEPTRPALKLFFSQRYEKLQRWSQDMPSASKTISIQGTGYGRGERKAYGDICQMIKDMKLGDKAL